jgi:hypothetical protein
MAFAGAVDDPASSDCPAILHVIEYPVIGEPPSAGAVHARPAVVIDGVAVRPVGAAGGVWVTDCVMKIVNTFSKYSPPESVARTRIKYDDAVS